MRPRPRTALPMTDLLEAKDRNARGRGQGHRRKCSQEKIFFRRSPKKRSSKYFFLVLELHSRGVYVQAYADDLEVLVTGADMLCIRGMAQKATHITANWASEQELQFSSKKTEGLPFTHNRNCLQKFGEMLAEMHKSACRNLETLLLFFSLCC